jgi:hypothetical protein
MSKPTDIQQLIEGHFLGNLSNAESTELEALLLADQSLRDDFRQAAALDTALRDIALEPLPRSRPLDCIQSAPAPEAKSAFMSEATPLPISSPTRGGSADLASVPSASGMQPRRLDRGIPRRIVIALAAMLLLGFGIAAYLLAPRSNDDGSVADATPEPLPFVDSIERLPSELAPVEFDEPIVSTEMGWLEIASDNLRLSNAQEKDIHPEAGRPIRNGDVLWCPAGKGGALVELSDGSRIALTSGTRVVFTQIYKQYRLTLEAGSLSAEVEKQPKDHPLLIASPNATATVLGTRFTLTAAKTTTSTSAPPSTRLIVEEGSVALASKASGESVIVAADEMTVAEGNRPMQVVDISDLRVSGIEIVRATYGHNSAWIDVTDAIRSRISGYRLIPTGVFNDLLEDPSFEREKVLFIAYKIDGKDGGAEFDEWAVQPKEKAATSVTLPMPGQ